MTDQAENAVSDLKVSGDWLEAPATQRVLALLSDAGFQAYPVGGCVRNALLNMPVADVDIASDAQPGEVLALAKAARIKALPTGIDHGTITLVVDGQPFEITTFRRDVETDGRHAVVHFSKDIAEDAARRDFTMNALYACANGRVLDPTGSGIADALARRLRFVGEPLARIREDYLRILRFFRFNAWYGDPAQGPDPEALAACAEGAEGIETLSHERLGAEMRKLLSAPDPAPSLASMAAAGVLAQVLPGADPRALPILVHLQAGRSDWLPRLAVLGGTDVANQLRLSKAEAKALAALRAAMGNLETPAVLGWRLGADLGRDAILARAASFEMPPASGWEAEVARGASAIFPVKAEDLPALNGPALGARLKELQSLWLSRELRPTKAELLA